MSDKKPKYVDVLTVRDQNRPVFRYAFGITFIMGYALALGGDLAYIVPYLALNFLTPGAKKLSIKESFNFIFIVALTSIAGFLFTSLFYQYTFAYLLLLGWWLFYLFYTDRWNTTVKLFMLISLLAYPVPPKDLSPTVWAYAITNTLVFGSLFSLLVVQFVYLLFPDKQGLKSAEKKSVNTLQVTSKERFFMALGTFVVTFPVVVLFVIYQWSDALLVLLYIVFLTTMQEAGKTAGKVKIYGNLIGGVATVIFYQLIVVAPHFFFLLVLLYGVALLFAQKIFSGKPNAVLYKTGFSALVLIVGTVSGGTESAGGEIGVRIFQVMLAVGYVVIALKLLEVFKQHEPLTT